MHSLIHSSTQSAVALVGGKRHERYFPSSSERVPGHKMHWGKVEELGSPAYWAAQSWMWEISEPEHFRLGRTLREEVLACLLGGYGIPAEVGLAAYQRLRSQPINKLLDASQCMHLLSQPLDVGDRSVKYRFVNQKSRYVSAVMAGLDESIEGLDDIGLRDALAGLPGIGLKTASWIVRNWRGSDAVSILDIHIIRASNNLGIFESTWRVAKHYRRMEQAYLTFCASIGARASILDSVMWMTMRQLPASFMQSSTEPTIPPKARRRKKVDDRQLQLV